MTWYVRVLVILGIVLCLGSASQAQTPDPQSQPPPTEVTRPETRLAVFDEVWQSVRDYFYDPTLHHLDWAAMREKYRPLAAAAADEERSVVINRLLDELAASHTRYYTPEDPAYYQLLDIFAGPLRRELRRVFPDGQVMYPSIGIFTQRIGDKTFISGILDGFPAAKAGLRVGDELLAADGTPYHPIRSLTATVNQEVTLQVRRSLDAPPQDVVVVELVHGEIFGPAPQGHVAAAAQEIGAAFNRGRLETTLPQMPGKIVTPTAMVHVGAQQARHQSRQPTRIRQLLEEMKMVGQEAIVVDPQRKALLIASDQVEERLAIFVVGEDGLAVMAAVHQVITSFLSPLEAAWHARHGESSPQRP